MRLLLLGLVKLILEILNCTCEASLLIIDLEAKLDCFRVVERTRPRLDDRQDLFIRLVGYELESFRSTDLLTANVSNDR